MSVPAIIPDLVRAFQKDERTYYDSAYSEAQARISFIDPFLEALGWHPRPDPAYIAEWRDCIVEQPVNVKEEPHKKRADYTCRIGKTPVLIIEAKAPRDDIFTTSAHALQVRSYAYSSGLPLCALTNFAQLVIYDGRVRPKKDDTYRVAQLETIRFSEYGEKWNLIESLLSEDAVRRGAQREYMQRRTAKGLMPVDQAILAEIDRWREELAHVIARLNPDLNAETLGFVVGRIIDRILFLRVCESRGTEPEGQLKSLGKGPEVYPRLLKLFHLADERYNSGLFYFAEERGRAERPDTLTEKLRLEDKPLRQIIGGLYYPENLYEYSLIPVEILGQVYEQFLGKVVVIPRSGSARIEDKPEVKKAGGVYYTPSYIVNYIVEHTIGKLVEDKTPKQIEKLRVLDPACGSGSFLLGAYQFLLDWYLKYYIKDGPAKHQKEIIPDVYEDFRLTLRERKRILLAHIYGVDIDAQAVEVTKLSLLLKVLEGETHDTVESELKLRERALPDLGKNIKCGNSLISTDFYKFVEARGFKESSQARGFSPLSDKVEAKARGFSPLKKQIRGLKESAEARGFSPLSPSPLSPSPLSDEARRRINPFDWQGEFPQVFLEKGRTFWLVTFVTHNARVSDRMVEFGVQKGEPLIFTDEERERVADILSTLWKEHGIPVVAGNVLSDHVHLVMAAGSETELDEHVRKLKGASSYRFSREVRPSEGGHVWQQKFNRKPLTSERALHDAQEYVWNNHLKHDSSVSQMPGKGLQPLVPQPLVNAEESGNGLQPIVNAQQPGNGLQPEEQPGNGLQPIEPDKGLKPPCLTRKSGKGLQPLVPQPLVSQPLVPQRLEADLASPPYLERIRAACTTVEDAATVAGGFDAVIGNPPYVRQETLGHQFKDYAKAKFAVYHGIADLYAYFIEQSHCLLTLGGYFGMICSNKWMRANYGGPLREFITLHTQIEQIVDFGELKVFQNAATFPAIILTRKSGNGLQPLVSAQKAGKRLQPAEQSGKGLQPAEQSGKGLQLLDRTDKGLKPLASQHFVYAPIKRLDFSSLDEEVSAIGLRLDNRALAGYNWALTGSGELDIVEKMKACGVPLGEYVNDQIYRGILTGLNEAFVIDGETRKRLIKADKKSAELVKPFVVGDDVRKYRIKAADRYLIFTRHGTDITRYPAIREHLKKYRKQLEPRPKGVKTEDWPGRKPGPYKWYEIQDNVAYWPLFEKPKIVYPDIAKESRFMLDAKGLYFGNTVYFIAHPTERETVQTGKGLQREEKSGKGLQPLGMPDKGLKPLASPSLMYLLGLLNSKLIFQFMKRHTTVLGDADKGGRLRFFRQDVVKLPIRTISFSDKADKSRHDKMVKLVERMLKLHQDLKSECTEPEKVRIERQIKATDDEIDRLVYELYGLTEDEIRIVESA